MAIDIDVGNVIDTLAARRFDRLRSSCGDSVDFHFEFYYPQSLLLGIAVIFDCTIDKQKKRVIKSIRFYHYL